MIRHKKYDLFQALLLNVARRAKRNREKILFYVVSFCVILL
jgi:hypothetical protein